MPESPRMGVGKLDDPDWRRERASKAGRARTTPQYHLDRIAEIVAESRAAQGLPPVVADELTLAKVADLIRSAEKGAATRGAA